MGDRRDERSSPAPSASRRAARRRGAADGEDLHDLRSVGREDRAGECENRVRAPRPRGSKCRLKVLGTKDVQILKLHAERLCGAFRLSQGLSVARLGRSPEDRHAREPRNDLFEQLELLSVHLGGHSRQASDVAARSCETGDEPVRHRIAIIRDDDGNRPGGCLDGTGSRRTPRDDEVDLET
jgi:hypothetical protein